MPFDGFRTYDAINFRLTALALESDLLLQSEIGRSVDDRPIWGYLLTGTEELTPDGFPKATTIITGTTHAREWGSPEIVAQFIESIVENADDPYVQYMLEHQNFVIVPVLNPDGFLQTQRWYDRYWGSLRDGRMRRKNMRNVDEDINTGSDNLLGVDLNRNFPVGWENGNTSTTSLIYRGTAAASEPETQALIGMWEHFGSPGEKRLYLDVHGAIPALYYIRTGTPSVDQRTTTIAFSMQNVYQATTGIMGAYAPQAINPPFAGVADEYFGVTYQIPAITIEYPTPGYRNRESIGNIFVTPDNEITDIVDENILAMTMAALMMSDPAILSEVQVRSVADDTVVFAGNWSVDDAENRTRVKVVQELAPLRVGREYELELTFNQPMRIAGELFADEPDWSMPTGYIGLTVPGQPELYMVFGDTQVPVSPIGTGWLGEDYSRYPGDRWRGTFTVPEVDELGDGDRAVVRLHLSSAEGGYLDTDPTKAARWDAGWIDYETSEYYDENFSIPFVLPGPMDAWMIVE